jgi:hypothetical protein
MSIQSTIASNPEVKQKCLLISNPENIPSVTIAAGQTKVITTIPHPLKKTPFVSGMWTRDVPGTNPNGAQWMPIGQTNDKVWGNSGGDLNSQWQIYADKNNIYVEVYCWSINAAFTAYFQWMAFELEILK